MGDTPLPKPDPAPVQLALDKLAITRAIMIGYFKLLFHILIKSVLPYIIGDTPDDINAALGAGIKAIGVVAPGVSDVKGDERVLSNTGAFIILNKGLPELQQLL